MKYTSMVYSAASGSIGGVTYSRNRGGLYTRTRAIPSNPNTEPQGIARENLATAVGLWTNNLTDTQRQAWSTYAQSTPVIDRLGQQVTLSGQQMFVRTATIRLVAGLPNVLDGPIISGLGTTPQWVTDPAVFDDSNVDFDLAAPGTTADGDFVIYASRPVVGSRTPAHETRRYAHTAAEAAGAASGSFTGPFAYSAGQRTRITAIYAGDDGRISAEAFRDVLVVASP